MKVAAPRVRPPAVDGAPGPRLRDALKFVWWAERGYLYGAIHGVGAGRVFSAWLALCWWPALPLSIPVQFALMARPMARYYLTPERDAVLAVVARAGGWEIAEHASARPGSHRGEALHSLIEPHLFAAADAGSVWIVMTAASQKLAAAYMAALPGLENIGRGFPRGRRLSRRPRLCQLGERDECAQLPTPLTPRSSVPTIPPEYGVER